MEFNIFSLKDISPALKKGILIAVLVSGLHGVDGLNNAYAQTPSIPSISNLPNIPNVANAPSIPNIPNVSNISSSGTQIIQDLRSGSTSLSQASNLLSQRGNISASSASNLLGSLQNNPSIDNITSGNLLNGIMSGQSGINAGNIGNVTNAIQGLANGGGTQQAISGAINGIASGAISPEIGQALGSIPNIGDLTSISSISDVFQNPQIAGALGDIAGQLGAPAQAAEALGAISNITALVANPQAILQNPQAIAGLAQSVISALPESISGPLTAALGGLGGLTGALSGGIGGAASALTGGGGLDTLTGGALGDQLGGLADAAGGLGGLPGGGGAGTYESFPRDPKGQPVDKDCSAVCNCTCRRPIENNHIRIRAHMTDEFIKHRTWMIDEFFTKHVLKAMGAMTSQVSTIAVLQTQTIGKFFDAKHQLETQRLFQQLMAEAHKDYQPSEGLCEIGTSVRSLATSERKSDLGQVAFANRAMARQLRSGDVVSSPSESSDLFSRVDAFVKNHCSKTDNGNGLNFLCAQGGDNKERINKDVDFTRTLESKLTLDADFTDEALAQDAEGQPDAEDVFALTANLFAHDPLVFKPRLVYATPEGVPKEAAYNYLDIRSVAAKRSVAQNSIAAIAADRAKGDKESAPYLKKLVTELGIPDDEVEDILGADPSYFAQMEVLAKDVYQNPVFYTELYDKPANVLRKGVAVKAINLMQDRDLYKSQLRSEANLAVLLETMLQSEHNRVNAELSNMEPGE